MHVFSVDVVFDDTPILYLHSQIKTIPTDTKKNWPKYLPVQKENWNPGLVPVFLFFLGGFLFFSILDVFDVDEFTNLQTPLLCLFTNNKKKLNWKKFVMRLI